MIIKHRNKMEQKGLMEQERLMEIVNQFAIEGEVKKIGRLGNGLINDTYLVETEGGRKYVLQRVNHNVFRDVEGLQRNIEIVTNHLLKKLVERGEKDMDRKVVRMIKRKAGEETWVENAGEYWRVMTYVERSRTLEEVTAATAEAAGRAFGKFESDLSDLDEELTETIPDFHNMEWRLQQLRDAVASDPLGRVAEVGEILSEIEKRAEKMTAGERMVREGKLRKRVCHCDTKVNNMLFDAESDDVLCVIDLDTVMESTVFSDYGDFLRTGACTAAEDEPDTEKVGVDMEIFKAFTRGYLEGTKEFLTDTERAMLPHAAALFPYMQAVRFLADYINGDTYFKTAYEKHNLVRTRAQMKMLESVEGKMEEMARFIADQAL